MIFCLHNNIWIKLWSAHFKICASSSPSRKTSNPTPYHSCPTKLTNLARPQTHPTNTRLHPIKTLHHLCDTPKIKNTKIQRCNRTKSTTTTNSIPIFMNLLHPTNSANTFKMINIRRKPNRMITPSKSTSSSPNSSKSSKSASRR